MCSAEALNADDQWYDVANHGTVEHQWAQYGEVRADILVVKTTIAEVDRAMAEMSTQVQAQIDNVTASLEDKLTASSMPPVLRQSTPSKQA